MSKISKLPPMKILWGTKQGAEDWQEEILSTKAENFERVKVLAAKDGYNRFRVSTDDGSAPNFAKTVNR